MMATGRPGTAIRWSKTTRTKSATTHRAERDDVMASRHRDEGNSLMAAERDQLAKTTVPRTPQSHGDHHRGDRLRRHAMHQVVVETAGLEDDVTAVLAQQLFPRGAGQRRRRRDLALLGGVSDVDA